MAVVDEQLRVHGIQGLRITDASVMSVIINANTMAPTIMIAEKAADLIREERSLHGMGKPDAIIEDIRGTFCQLR